MPNPKRRHSSTRGRKRRTHWTLDLPGLSTCPKCHAAKLAHRICGSCGYYKDELIIAPKEV